MKFSVQKFGAWNKVEAILRDRKKRAEVMRRVVVRDLVGRMRAEIMKKIPQGDEFKPYREAFVQRELKGSFPLGEFAYALYVDPKPIALKTLNHREDVVYFVQRKAELQPLESLLIENGPWVIDRLPDNVGDFDGVKMVHRTVSSREVEGTRRANDKTLSTLREDFKAARAKFVRKPREPVAPRSTPDLLFLALRMEFGIMTARERHWGHALSLQTQIIKEMFRDRRKYARYVVDSKFTRWSSPLPKWDPMPSQLFIKMCRPFEKMIARQ